MTDIGFITITGIKNNLRSRIAVLIGLAVVLICAVGLVAAFYVLLIGPALKIPSPDRSQLEMYLVLILFTINLLGLGVNLNVFAFPTLTREKSRGVIQSLLATPLSERAVWLGNSLAIFLPGLIAGELLTLIALLVLNYAFFVPQIGFLINPWIVVSSFAAVPLMYLSVTLLIYLIGLTGKPASGNIIAQIFLPVIVSLMINLVLRSGLDVASWHFTAINLGIAVIFSIISLVLQPRLSKERIILSS